MRIFSSLTFRVSSLFGWRSLCLFVKITESYCERQKIVAMGVLEGHLTGENNYKELFEQAKLVSQLHFIIFWLFFAAWKSVHMFKLRSLEKERFGDKDNTH